MGCGRLGVSIATSLSDEGAVLHILDLNPSAFDLLPPGRITDGYIVPIVGDGTLESDQRKALTQDADVFIAVAGRDAPNALAAQVARHMFQVPTVICRLNDPTRQQVYTELGLITVSATRLVTDMVLEATGA